MKDIPGYEGLYAITEDGRVWSHKSNKFLAFYDNGHGYLYVGLRKDNKTKKYKVHRLVAETYLPNPDNLPIINHKDENKQNNKLDNLEWCSHTYNHTYSARKVARGPVAIVCIETGVSFPSIAAAAREVGINRQGIWNCLHGL